MFLGISQKPKPQEEQQKNSQSTLTTQQKPQEKSRPPITLEYLSRVRSTGEARGEYQPGFLAQRRRQQAEAGVESREWEDKGGYWLNGSPQGSEAWLALRKNLLTGSNVGSALGHSRFSGPLEVALDVAGVEAKVFSQESQRVMAQGTQREPLAREKYMRMKDVHVEEVGLAIPKWEPRLGSSLDGDVIGTEGVIEIKSPDKGIYRPLLEYERMVAKGWSPPPGYHQHIWDSHYDQMQVGMKVAGKTWCDYVVYSAQEERIFVDRVPLNDKYWETVLEPGIKNFLENILEPLIYAKEKEWKIE